MYGYEIYIAAPFFSPLEVGTVETIENMLRSKGISYFSPRSDGGNSERQSDVLASASDIFKANIDAMDCCRSMLAVLDRYPADNHEVWMCERDVHDILLPIKGPLKQPDIGTVWELGYMYAMQQFGLVPDPQPAIFGFTRVARNYASMNVMLLEGVSAMCYGLEELEIAMDVQFDVSRYHAELTSRKLVPFSASNYKGVRTAI